MGRTFQNVLHSVCGSRSFTLMRSLPLGRRCGRLCESSFLIKMLSESRTVYQRLADGTARKRSVEDRSDEKNYAQRPHDRGKLMQAVVGRMLTVDEAKKTGRSDRADISRRTLQTRCSTDLGRRRLDVDRCLGSGGR